MIVSGEPQDSLTSEKGKNDKKKKKKKKNLKIREKKT